MIVADAMLGFILGITSLVALALLLMASLGRKMSQGLCVRVKNSKSSSMENLNHRMIASTPKTANETLQNIEYENPPHSFESTLYQKSARENEFVEEFFTENFKQESSVSQRENVDFISKYSTLTTNFYSNSYRN